MKELSIEAKARRYDEAIKVAADIKAGTATYITDWTPVIEAIFPELRESEDERIRKELIDFLEYYRLNNVLDSKTTLLLTDSVALLEKQGEQKQELLTKEKALKNYPFIEQNPVPKFKIGDTMRTLQEAKDVRKRKSSGKYRRKLRYRILDAEKNEIVML